MKSPGRMRRSLVKPLLMKLSSPLLFVTFLVGVAVAEEAGASQQLGAPLVKRAPTEQEKADMQAQKDAEKEQRAAEKEAARLAREAEKSAAATEVVSVV